jgi:hypothetical protein
LLSRRVAVGVRPALAKGLGQGAPQSLVAGLKFLDSTGSNVEPG